ncbi:hypothetical protein CAter282_4327 [Collimonas arenae]|uniref:Lysozyme inhibitor LprI-like N-terminal domain-containing protein n=2 Tax=Collimonas arenae TaxID=279058 RepID=A0A127PXJ2_9BURK|nr:lysozyme inhibitor LprI family protein [Collimonas arenae]AMP02092.1 hypothetical protein CAter10_4702 [Collimonas arenae]AMP11987.1 hypothetical protein CAter282_4327 [Collimonas arenae]
MIVSMKNDAGLVRQVKVGFCWTAFFFGALPFFFRGMPSTGFLWCCTLFIGNFVLPFKMNKYTAQYYLEHGYKPYGKGWHKAALAWGVAIPSTGEETTNDAFSDEPESSKYVFKIWHALVAVTVIPGILMAMFGSHENKSAKSEPVEQVVHIQPTEPVAPAIIDTPAALDKAVVTQMAEIASSQNPIAETPRNDIAKSESPKTEADIPPANANNAVQSWTPSFDCAKASNGPERLICSSPELSAADVRLGQVYKSALNNAKDTGALRKRQNEWRKLERDGCSDVSCMLKAYQNRITELAASE